MFPLSAGRRRQGRKGGNPRTCEVPVVDDRWALAGQNKYEGEGWEVQVGKWSLRGRCIQKPICSVNTILT